MDRICLTGLRAAGRHGVLASERENGQEFVVDAELEIDLGPAAGSDSLADTVDYGALAQQIHDAVAGPPVSLIETLAAAVANVCLQDPRVHRAHVTVHKPQAPIAVAFSDVCATVTRP